MKKKPPQFFCLSIFVATNNTSMARGFTQLKKIYFQHAFLEQEIPFFVQ